MIQNSTRRTALKAGLLSAGFTATAAAAHAMQLAPGTLTPTSWHSATSRYSGMASSPIILTDTAIEVNFRSIKLELLGSGGPQQIPYENSSDTVNMVNMPSQLVIRNNGNQTIEAGTVVELSARRLQGSGLLEKDTRAFVTRAGVVEDHLVMRSVDIEGSTSSLALAFDLPAGKSVTVSIDWKAHASVNKTEYSHVQFVASCLLDTSMDNFVQALSTELLAVRV